MTNMSKFVVLKNLPRHHEPEPTPPADASHSVVLRSLKDTTHMARLDAFASEGAAGAAGGEVHELLFAVRGSWDQAPSHAVCAVWEIRNATHAAAFIESRRQLFALRQQVLPTFAADWLLKHRDHAGRYMVFGFYGDEEGATRLCREHPRIQAFAAAHPASAYGAVDLTGLLCWRIEGMDPATRWV